MLLTPTDFCEKDGRFFSILNEKWQKMDAAAMKIPPGTAKESDESKGKSNENLGIFMAFLPKGQSKLISEVSRLWKITV